MIEFCKVNFSYNANEKILNDVSFKIEDHQWVSIIGHNGSGKSTIAKLLVGLIQAQSGTITYDGVELKPETVNDIRKKVGIVFQNPDNQFVGYNVKYDIAFGLENHQVPRDKMIELIANYTEKVGMAKELEREPQTLSGGQKQRVAIAGILALDCDIIIFDEATSMLDPQGSAEIVSIIKELARKYHKLIITITHDLALAGLSDKILVIKEGKLIKEGSPSEVFLDRKILQSSNLDLPFSLRFHNEALEVPSLRENKELMEALWEYHLRK